jgi:methylamine dehydrogenase accessory protein MauD
MTGIWLYSYIFLWLVVLALAWLTLTLLRLVGQLHQRLGPAGAAVTSNGLDVGERLPDILETHNVVDHALFSFPKKRDCLLVFVSPQCAACEDLIPSLIPFANRERGELDVMVISNGDKAGDNGHFSKLLAHKGITFVVAPDLTLAARVGGTPFAFWLDSEGVVRAKGIVNHTEHIESLKNARLTGFATDEERRDSNRETGGVLK